MTQFTNQASVRYNGIVANSNIVAGKITKMLTAGKDSTVTTYKTDEVLTYVISIINSGTIPYTGLTVTDNLGAYTAASGTVVPLTYTGDPVLYYIDGALQTSPAVTAGPPLVISGIDVPAESSAVIIYHAKLNEYAPFGEGASIKNTASIIGGGLEESISVTNTVTADQSAAISIFKALNPTTVFKNGELNYTFTLQNTGPVAADVDAGIVISDAFDPVLTVPLTVTLNGELWPQVGNYSYNTSDGTFATLPGKVTVPAATYTQNPTTGAWNIIPGVTILTVTGKI